MIAPTLLDLTLSEVARLDLARRDLTRLDRILLNLVSPTEAGPVLDLGELVDQEPLPGDL